MSTPLKEVFAHDSWVCPYFSKYRTQLLWALGLGLVSFAFAALLMFASGYLISRTAEQPGGVFMILYPVAFVQIFGLGKPIARYIERLASHDWVFRMTSSLQLRLYTALERNALFVKRRHRTGDVLGLVAEDIGHIQNLYLRTVFPTVIALLLYVIVVCALGFFSLWFAGCMLLILGVNVIVLPLVSLLVNRARVERHKATKNALYTDLADNVIGSTDWVIAGRGNEYLQRYARLQDGARRTSAQIDRYSRISDFVAMVVFGVGVCATLWWAGGHFGGQHGQAANWIAAFVLGFFPLIEAFMPLPMAVTQVHTYKDSVVRLNDYPETDEDRQACAQVEARFATDDAPFIVTLDEDVDTPAPSEALDEVSHDSGEYVLPQPTVQPADLTLRLDNVGFSYDGNGKAVLDGIDLSIAAGQRVAILGRSGSGKSTMASLMRGDLAPTSGTATLGGIDTTRFGDGIASYIGVVAQDAYLFNRTLRDNLTLGNPQATDEQVWDALERVGLKTMVQRLPRKLSTMVDEAGMRFSGGERNRIALARVLLANTPIVLLDEPTVGLDPITEHAVMETLLDATHGKTLVMITHHLMGIEAFDRVVFVENGRIELDGPPAQLAATNQRYRDLVAFDQGLIA